MRYFGNVLIGVGLLFMALVVTFAVIEIAVPPSDTADSVIMLAVAVVGAGTGIMGVLLRRQG